MTSNEVIKLAKRLFNSEMHGWGGTASEKITNTRKAGAFLKEVNYSIETWDSKQKKWMYGA